MRKRYAAIFVTALLISMSALSGAQPADSPWPMFQRDARRTGASIYTGPAASPRVRVLNVAKKIMREGPIIGSDGTMYTGSDDGNLYAVNSIGFLAWSYNFYFPVWHTPAIDVNGTVYCGAPEYNFVALNSNGSLSWSYYTRLSYSSPAIDDGGRIYHATWTANRLYVFEPDGTMAWSYLAGKETAGYPAIGTDGTSYLGANDNHLYAFTPNGALRWSYDTGTGSAHTSLGPGGVVYAASPDKCFYALGSDGSCRWSYRTTGYTYAPAAVGPDGSAHLGVSGVCLLYSLASSGSLQWSYHAYYGQNSDGAPTVDRDGVVYTGSSDNNIYVLSSRGSLMWSYCTGTPYISSAAIGFPKDRITLTVGKALVRIKTSNYINITADPQTLTLGGPLALSWQCDFGGWDFADTPVNVYLAAIQGPAVVDDPSRVEDLLSGSRVFIAEGGLRGWYLYRGRVAEPTWSNLRFLPGAGTDRGSLTLNAPASPLFGGDWVFAAVFIRADTGRFVRNDGTPVENSNLFRLN